MITVRYLNYPQVLSDPSTPVTLWGLSAVSRERVAIFSQSRALRGTSQIASSAEKKALETAQSIAAALAINLEVREAMHENDRSATGFLPPDEFEVVANKLFAQPLLSVRGWERAIDAQARIVREVETVLQRGLQGDVLFVGHGAVGTLLFCHYEKADISRAHDQPAGGCHFFTFLKEPRQILQPWRRMEELK